MLPEYHEDCRLFTGYKPCRHKRKCAGCPHYDPVRVRLAVVSLEAMGAVLRSTCLLPPLQRAFPGAHITWITLARNRPLLGDNPLIDRLITVCAESSQLLRHLEFDHIFGVDKSLAAGALVESMQAADKRGFGLSPAGVIRPLNDAAHYQYQVGLDDDLKFFTNTKPETQQLTESMGLVWERDPYVLHLTVDEVAEVARRRKLIAPADERIIGYNTGCSDAFPYKRFTVERAIEVVRAWRAAFPEAVVALLGGPEDTERQRAIKAAFADDARVYNTPTEDGLRSGILWMDTADLVFSGCSLGMHIAIALRKPVIAWFGVSCAQEVDLYGRGEKLEADVSCNPCWRRHCNNEPKCYDQVAPERIVAATERLLRGSDRPAESIG